MSLIDNIKRARRYGGQREVIGDDRRRQCNWKDLSTKIVWWGTSLWVSRGKDGFSCVGCKDIDSGR